MHFSCPRTTTTSTIIQAQDPHHPPCQGQGGKVKACEAALAQQGPLLSQGKMHMGILPRGRGESISTCLDRNLADTPHCPYLGPRQQIHCWQAMGADNVLLRGIAKGVKEPLHHIPAPKSPRPPPPGYHLETMTTIGEYLKSGVIRHLTPKEVVNTNYWVLKGSNA